MKLRVQVLFVLIVASLAEDLYRLGCFKDEEDRAPHVFFDVGDEASPRVCSRKCASYPYFGMQAGDQCWCGDSYNKHKKVDDGECSMKCKGDARYTCGNHLRNDVYKFTSFKRLGCFMDKWNDRAMPTQRDGAGKASPSYCSTACKNSTYFGLQFGDWCTCGDGDRGGYDKHGKVDDEQCNMNCTGDPAYTCGSLSRNDIYINFEFKRLGCFEDRAEWALEVHLANTGKESPMYCAQQCKDYRYFGLQAGGHCTCGNYGYRKYGQLSDSECSMKCQGDSRFTCGNHWRNEVYLNLDKI